MNSIENSVLKTATQINQAAQAAKTAAPAPQEAVKEEAAAPVQSAPVTAPSFDTMDTVPETNVEENFEGEEDIDAPEDDNHDGLGFDIF